ncbi:NACHT domain-containing protein [Micromonospora sp. NPDC003197]
MLSEADSIASIIGTSLALLLAAIGGIAAWRRHRESRSEAAAPVRSLLSTQRSGVLAHAHRFLDGNVSPLAVVYVPQRILGDGGDGSPPPAAGSVATPVAADRLLHTDRHVLLIGTAGSGKTAFVGHALTERARSWAGRTRAHGRKVAEVGVTIPATALIGRSLPEAIARTYRSELPQWLLVQRPAPHARWLVLVDGLDQITDSNVRSRVLGQLREWAGRTDHPYRLLLTTRPLAEEESTALRDRFAEHRLLPFDEDDLASFARRWFTARIPDPTRAATAGERFRADLAQARLDELAYHPLLVTLAALTWERRSGPVPDGAELPPLPPGRAEFLDRFVTHLVAGADAAVDTLVEALRHRAGPGTTIADWLAEHVGEVFEAAAEGYLRTGRAVPEAVSWIDRHAPAAPTGLLPDWPNRIAALLVGTGLFTPLGVDVEPVAHGVAEYLAAGPLARSWHEERWLTLMADPATRGMAGFVLARAGLETEPFLRRLADGPDDRVLAVGHLLAAGTPVGPEVRDEVLAALLRTWYEGSGRVAAECLSVLGALVTTPSLRQAIYHIATDSRWPRRVRGAASTFIAVPALRQRPGTADHPTG